MEEIQEQWQHDDFFGPRGYSNKLHIAPDGWGIGPGESDDFQETEGVVSSYLPRNLKVLMRAVSLKLSCSK